MVDASLRGGCSDDLSERDVKSFKFLVSGCKFGVAVPDLRNVECRP